MKQKVANIVIQPLEMMLSSIIAGVIVMDGILLLQF